MINLFIHLNNRVLVRVCYEYIYCCNLRSLRIYVCQLPHIDVIRLEDKDIHVICCTFLFFVCQCSVNR